MFTFTGRISAKREAPDAAIFRRIHSQRAMDKEKSAADGRLAADRKLTEKVNMALEYVGAKFASCLRPKCRRKFYTTSDKVGLVSTNTNSKIVTA